MKLRFEVDQAACLRAGIDCPKSIVTVEVDPAKLPQDDRDVLADRLDGIDVCQLHFNEATHQIEKKHWTTGNFHTVDNMPFEEVKPKRIIAKAPTLEGLLVAAHDNETEVQRALNKHQGGLNMSDPSDSEAGRNWSRAAGQNTTKKPAGR